jgi:hypothetical protein
MKPENGSMIPALASSRYASKLAGVVGNVPPWYLFRMEPPRFLSRLAEAAKGVLGRKKPAAPPPPAMIGLPPSARGLTGRPTAFTEHASEVAREWQDVGEAYVQKRMRELGIPGHQIGAPDYERGGIRRAFLPEEIIGGTHGTGGRLFVDSGALNPQLNAEDIGPEASKVWTGARLRDRIDAVIAHEHLEAQGVPHEEVVQLAPDTELPICENARKILRTMAEGAKRER